MNDVAAGAIFIALVFLVIGYIMGRIAAKPIIVGQAKEYDVGDSKHLYDEDPYQEALEGPRKERTDAA